MLACYAVLKRMKRLLLLRHAKAVPGGDDVDDEARVLAPRGRDDAAAMGRYLRKSGAAPRPVLVSPAARTLETASLVLRELDRVDDFEILEALYLATPGTILAQVQAAPRKAGEIMVVGHNPGMESLFLILADKKPAGIAGEKFPTCALAVLDFAIDDWPDVAPGAGMLARFLTPADL